MLHVWLIITCVLEIWYDHSLITVNLCAVFVMCICVFVCLWCGICMECACRSAGICM